MSFMRPVVGSVISRNVRPVVAGKAFTPRSLFAGGTIGAWYDPSDLSTMFQDAAGTTPASVDGVVGLMLDKSRGLAKGPEITNVTIANSVAGVNEVIDLGDNTFRWVGDGSTFSAVAFTISANTSYYVQPVVVDHVTGAIKGNKDAADSSLYSAFTTTPSSVIAVGPKKIEFGRSTSGAAIDMTVRFEVRELPGYHASQATTASKPILRQDAAGRYYLEFDGVDDYLVTSSIDFTGTDKMSVFAGVRKLSDALRGVFAELSSSSSTNPGAFLVQVPGADATANYSVSHRGVTGLSSTSVAITAPATSVLALTSNLTTPELVLRANGQVGGSTTTDTGGGNYGNYPLYIGRRGGTTYPFNGWLYGLIVAGKLANTSEINAAERWMNRKTGSY